MKLSWQTAGTLMLAGVFGWAGAMKAADPAAFAGTIAGFRLTSWPVGVAVALYLPWLELVVAMALLFARCRSTAQLIAAALSTGFVLLWAISWARGLDVACGCFGGHAMTNAAWALLRATLLAGLAWALVIK